MFIKNILVMVFMLLLLGCELAEREEELSYKAPINNNINDDSNKDSASQKLSEKSGEEIFIKCAGCHGASAEKSALGQSDIIKYWEVESIVQALQEYKSGTRDMYGAGGLMKGQVQDLNDDEMRNVAQYIRSF